MQFWQSILKTAAKYAIWGFDSAEGQFCVLRKAWRKSSITLVIRMNCAYSRRSYILIMRQVRSTDKFSLSEESGCGHICSGNIWALVNFFFLLTFFLLQKLLFQDLTHWTLYNFHNSLHVCDTHLIMLHNNYLLEYVSLPPRLALSLTTLWPLIGHLTLQASVFTYVKWEQWVLPPRPAKR